MLGKKKILHYELINDATMIIADKKTDMSRKIIQGQALSNCLSLL